MPRTDASINGATGNRFIVDTGGPQIGILVFDYFARNNPTAISGDAPASNVLMSGVGGRLDLDSFLAKSIIVGRVAFKDYGGYRTKGTVYGSEDGLIGPTFLRFFTVYVDYPRRRMILIPNATGRAAMHLKN